MLYRDNHNMKYENPIEEIWRIREALSAEEGYEVHRLFERLRREEMRYEDRLIRRAPNHAPAEATTALRERTAKID
jgi:hypothetical protein